MISKLNVALGERFGTLSKTLLFEYGSIADLAGYFVAEHTERVRELSGPATPRDSVPTIVEVPVTEPESRFVTVDRVRGRGRADPPAHR